MLRWDSWARHPCCLLGNVSLMLLGFHLARCYPLECLFFVISTEKDVDLDDSHFSKNHFSQASTEEVQEPERESWNPWSCLSFGLCWISRSWKVSEICSVSTFESPNSKVKFVHFRDFEQKSPRTLNRVL